MKSEFNSYLDILNVTNSNIVISILYISLTNNLIYITTINYKTYKWQQQLIWHIVRFVSQPLI